MQGSAEQTRNSIKVSSWIDKQIVSHKHTELQAEKISKEKTDHSSELPPIHISTNIQSIMNYKNVMKSMFVTIFMTVIDFNRNADYFSS